MKKALNMAENGICPLETSLPPHQKSNAQGGASLSLSSFTCLFWVATHILRSSQGRSRRGGLSMEGEGHCLSGCACVPRKSNPAPSQEIEGGKEEKSSTATTALASATKHLLHIEIDYGHHVLEHRAADKEIAITYDTRNGARWRTTNRFDSGTFSAKIRTPAGNTSGLNCSFYLSSLEGDKTQDEIDFEFLGKDKSIIQTNVYTTGTGNREVIHDLGFDSSQEFHEYTICWTHDKITWYIDGAEIRTLEKVEAQDFPTKPMFLYASVWNAGDIDSGKWAGRYVGCNEPYVCTYKDVLIPDS